MLSYDEVELDEKKLTKLKGIIYDLERENLNKKKYRSSEMHKKVLDAIKREVLD